MPIRYVVLLDVSYDSVQSGFLAETCAALQEALPLFPAASELAIITFDRAIHFYDISVRV